MLKPRNRIPILDINQSAFHMLHHDEPEEELQPGGRIAFIHKATERFYELAARYNANESVPVQDFVNCQRQLKACMMALKNGNGKRIANGYRKNF
jgi:hypothetical protein